MKSSLALQIKSWTSKIHPPLPRIPRESQQLLTALNTSFRRQLDEHYPPLRNWPGVKRCDHKSSENSVHSDARPSNPSSAASTDQHFRFILSHPLFSKPKQKAIKDGVPLSKGLEHGKTGVAPHNDLVERSRLLRNPMQYFDQMVASGSATPENVGICLRAQRTASLCSSEIDTRDNMRKSGAGSRVVRWFATTTDENKLAFLRGETVNITVPFLLAEDLRNTLWRWILTLQELKVDPA